MSGHDLLGTDFSGYRLGDIITLPDGRAHSIRMLAALPHNDLDLAHLVMLGELEMLLAPSRRSTHVLLPVEQMPPQLSSARWLLDGAAAYWSPHLPALSGAMGEVLYRLMVLRSSFAPAVAVSRGEDVVFFVKAGELDLDDLRVLRMPRTESTDAEIGRFAAVVDPLSRPVPVPQIPQPARHAPERVPARTR